MVHSYTRGARRMGQNGSTTVAFGQRFSAIREVSAYWHALRDDQDLPRREQINPRGMAGALHQVFMLERVAPGVMRFRIAGMEINALMGMEVRGMPLSALFDPAARPRLAELVEKALIAPTIVDLGLEAERGLGRPALQARLILLPLKSARGEADLILGCLAYEGDIGRAPRRFVIARAVELALEIPPSGHGTQVRPEPERGTAPALSPRALQKQSLPIAGQVSACDTPATGPVARTVAERPYLRLVRLED